MNCRALIFSFIVIGTLTSIGLLIFSLVSCKNKLDQQTEAVCQLHPSCCIDIHHEAGVEFQRTGSGIKAINRNDFTVSIERKYRYSNVGSTDTINVNEVHPNRAVRYESWMSNERSEQFIIYRQSGAPIGSIKLSRKGISSLRARCRKRHLAELAEEE